MPTAQQVMTTACQEIGYTRWDDPEEGSKYGRDYATRNGAYFGASGVPFCAMFVTWCFRQWGATPPGGDFAYVPHVIQRAAATGQLVSKYDAQFGDIVCFDWDGDGVADHVGFVYSNLGSYVQTVEGNTSSGASGSQSNGGGVYSRARDWEDICAVVRPTYGGASSPTPSAPAREVKPYTGKKNRSDGQSELTPNGVFGPATIARLQQVMGTAIDGVLDEDGSPAVERLQSFLNSAVQPDQQTALNDSPRLDVDGVLGAATWRTLQFLIMAWHKEYLPDGWDFADWVDGEAGTATIGALQRALNNSRAGSGRLW